MSTSSTDFGEFKSKIETLRGWDPKSQLITRNLDLKAKPKRLGFCRRFALLFTHSRSKEVVLAIHTLQNLTQEYKNELKDDEEALETLKRSTLKIQKYLTTKNQKTNIIKSKSTRNKIDKLCTSLLSECDHLQLSIVKKSKKYESLKITSVPQLLKFLRKLKPKTIEEATFYFKQIQKLNFDLNKEQANEILILTKKIKLDVLKKNEKSKSRELTYAHFQIRCQIRKHFFHERLKQNKADLDAVKNKFKKSRNQNSKTQEIIKEWNDSLKKMKPIDMPKWFHCTKPQYINKILKSGEILVMAVAFEGAFASTKPESETYGQFCIALGSNIEKNAQPPLITNVHSPDGSPVYLGDAPEKNDNRQMPVLWAGYKENISLKKPDKSKDPIGYYAHTNFCLLAYTGHNHKNAIDNILETPVKDALKERKIKILKKEDFEALTSLLARTFHCKVPKSWANAPLIIGTLQEHSIVTVYS